MLDDLFRKTKSMPGIYWLPLTDEQVRCITSRAFLCNPVVVLHIDFNYIMSFEKNKKINQLVTRIGK